MATAPRASKRVHKKAELIAAQPEKRMHNASQRRNDPATGGKRLRANAREYDETRDETGAVLLNNVIFDYY
jgi:hypothetical protein